MKGSNAARNHAAFSELRWIFVGTTVEGERDRLVRISSVNVVGQLHNDGFCHETIVAEHRRSWPVRRETGKPLPNQGVPGLSGCNHRQNGGVARHSNRRKPAWQKGDRSTLSPAWVPTGTPTGAPKTAYRTQHDALKAADERRRQSDIDLNVYQCEFLRRLAHGKPKRPRGLMGFVRQYSL